MRARSPLSLLLATIAAIAVIRAVPRHVPEPTFASLLLVAQSGCQIGDPSLFSQKSLERYAASITRYSNISHPYHLLNYEETCGINWETTVTRRALATLGAGGGVIISGRPGTTVCNSVSLAARALHRPQPSKCSHTHARGAAVVQLAMDLHWRRALLLPTSGVNECSVAQLEVERALIAAGVLVKHILTNAEDSTLRPHVIILCDLSINELNLAGNLNDTEILILRVDDSRILKVSDSTDEIKSKNEQNFQIKSPPTSNMILSEFLSDYFDSSQKINLPRPISYNSNELYSLPAKQIKSLKRSVPRRTILLEKLNSLNLTSTNRSKFNNSLHSKMENISFLQKRDSEDINTDYINSHLKSLELAISDRLLVLTDDVTKIISTSQTMYHEVLEATLTHLEAERKRLQYTTDEFFLYKSVIFNTSVIWRRVAKLTALSERSVVSSNEWTTKVAVDLPGELELKNWSRTRNQKFEELKIMNRMEITQLVVVMLCVACTLLGALTIGAFYVRRKSIRHMPRRPRVVPLLASADFQFPADERRRVGEGMETMLSWLQQFHEFGGSEPERPDLLKRPEPLVQSAPSSTCSVTRLAPDSRTRYKGDPVHMKYLPASTLELRRKTIDVLLLMQSLRHENLNPFIGCLTEIRPALVFEACGRGSLEDVLVADDIRLDWTFRLSLLTDLVRGMRYLHTSPLRVHARLSSRNCVVDSRWVLRITDYGLPSFTSAQSLPYPPRSARDLLWTAPEILRETSSETVPGGTQAGDVFSFAIIMQEVLVRGEPYCMLSLTPEEIVDKLIHAPPLIRPSVSMSAAPPEAVSVMRQCWSEQPDLRPDFIRLYEVFRHMHRGRKVNIVDSMFEMLEKYSNNLEELIKDRTEQLDMEKKKTEQLLNRMLPRSVAERLMLGLRVEPEEFEEVSIYFSDIVGFTSLAARSTPVQVVDLLNDLYTTFDAAIEQYRVYKVETIGDAYMVVGGLPIRCSDHAENVATMALHLLHLAGRFRIRHLPVTPLHLRIGLHTGACCAGVVGLTMPRYCLFGDTVNTASRMESTGI
ncbi:receptor-type guanylate cyclase gcy-12 isoform X2 [Nymphalis io]|uniref:receptor-type guanylate cyclase gcy-12 isoform X2 n=1 Tax=Inachis io TaxID=171585 RepID=UPI0021688F1A|nr:receptor-type guanylate cyclase gcy-12 isoform X2 [Nymphalis io]